MLVQKPFISYVVIFFKFKCVIAICNFKVLEQLAIITIIVELELESH